MLLYLTPNKVHFRCFGVLASIKSGLRFYVNLETDKKASWRPQDAEKVPTETFWDDFGPQVDNNTLVAPRPSVGVPKKKKKEGERPATGEEGREREGERGGGHHRGERRASRRSGYNAAAPRNLRQR